jgi:sulfate permease, SulP family
MFVVCENTFEWGTFKVFDKIPKHDALVIVAVTAATVFTNLASAVILGILIAALVCLGARKAAHGADAHQ